jgi:Zn ribbon nucleic-acid-binding protein
VFPKNKIKKMETRINNIAGDFDEIEITCPRCNSTNVVVTANENGYFEIIECFRCGYKKINRLINKN